MLDHSIKILWVSDIHFFKDYTTISDVLFDEYFEKFISETIAAHTEKDPITYIFLTGDLAQQGTTEDYEAFANKMLYPLLDRFLEKRQVPLPTVFCIPGNHDVNWSSSKFLSDYIAAIEPNITVMDRSVFLKNNLTSFRELFTCYSQFVKKHTADGNPYREFFDYNKDYFEVCPDYNENRLFGYLIDKRNGTILVLINTAWFSLGNQFNNLFAEQLFSQYSERPTAKQYSKEILQKKDLISEYSNQISGIENLDIDHVKRAFKNYPDYLRIFSSHHPLNWLQWNESYSYGKEISGEHKQQQPQLSSIISQCDIALSSHEHVPINFENEEILNTLHLRSGCFLFDNQSEGNICGITSSWFSILEINLDTNTIKQDRFSFKENHWQIQAEHHPISGKRLMLFKKDSRYTITPKRAKEIAADSLNLKNPAYLQNYVKKYLFKKNVTVLPLPEEIEDISFFEVEQDGKSALYLLINGYLNNVLNNGNLPGVIDKIMLDHRLKFNEVYTLIIDLSVNATAVKTYTYRNQSDNRFRALQAIVRTADIIHDRWRLKFYNRFESGATTEGTAFAVGNYSLFKHYCGIPFILQVIPHWALRRAY